MNLGIIGYGEWGSKIMGELQSLGHQVETYDLKPNYSTKPSLNALLSSSRAVLIASSSNLHYNHSLLALEAGKDVYCTKPLCLTWNQALTLQKLAFDRKLVLNGGFVFREAKAAKDFLSACRKRKPYYIEMEFENIKPPREDSSIVFNLMIHFLDLATLALGPLEGTWYRTIERASASFDFISPKGRVLNPISIKVKCNSRTKRRQIVIPLIDATRVTYLFDNKENTLRASLDKFLRQVRERNLSPENLLSIKYCEEIEREKEGAFGED